MPGGEWDRLKHDGTSPESIVASSLTTDRDQFQFHLYTAATAYAIILLLNPNHCIKLNICKTIKAIRDIVARVKAHKERRSSLSSIHHPLRRILAADPHHTSRRRQRNNTAQSQSIGKQRRAFPPSLPCDGLCVFDIGSMGCAIQVRSPSSSTRITDNNSSLSRSPASHDHRLIAESFRR